jgi:hypothetical protein
MVVKFCFETQIVMLVVVSRDVFRNVEVVFLVRHGKHSMVVGWYLLSRNMCGHKHKF